MGVQIGLTSGQSSRHAELSELHMLPVDENKIHKSAIQRSTYFVVLSKVPMKYFSRRVSLLSFSNGMLLLLFFF